jgi:hypothetical protein
VRDLLSPRALLSGLCALPRRGRMEESGSMAGASRSNPKGVWGRRAVAILVAVGLAACSNGTDNATKSSPSRGGAVTPADRHYGLAPDADPDVTYQPDVVVVGGGAESVRSSTADGLTWTIAPGAAHVDDLAVGKVMLLTNKSTGRIARLEHTRAGVVVTLVPVALGEVFKDADFAFDVPLSSDDIAFDLAPQPGGDTSTPPPGSASAGFTPSRAPGGAATAVPATLRSASAPRAAVPVVAARAERVAADRGEDGGTGGLSGGFFGQAFGSYPGATGFAQDKSCGGGAKSPAKPPAITSTSPFTNSTGPTLSPALEVRAGAWNFEAERQPGQLTFRASYVKGPIRLGLVFRVTGQLRISGTDTIRDGKERPSGIRLAGIDGITIGFVGGSASALDNVRARVDIPIDLEILTRQLYVNGIPFVLAAKPKFIIETAFGANNSTLWSCGDYKFNLDTVKPGEKPVVKLFQATRSLLPISGVSIGVNGIVLAFDLKVAVGLGVKQAYAGPFATFDVAVGATRGSDIGIINCQSADLVISGKGGVGFSLGTELASYLIGLSGKQYAAGNTASALKLQKFGNRLRNNHTLDFDQALYAGTFYEAHKTIPSNVPVCTQGAG